MREALTFDDVLLEPQYGVLETRSEADISSSIVNRARISIPIISANMPSVTDSQMAIAMFKQGAIGSLHRFNTKKENIEEYKKVIESGARVICSIGMKDGLERFKALHNAGCTIFILDIAHADSRRVIDFINDFWQTTYNIFYGEYVKLIVGNVATYDGALRLMEAGVDAIKVGIGPGAACSTREVTGFGVPQLSAIMEVARARQYFPEVNIKIIADGGIKNSGDIVKALAAGADTVMIGRLLAGCKEAPCPGVYFGNASSHINNHNAPEGIYGAVEHNDSVEKVLKKLAWGIRSGISYAGARNIRELREKAAWIKVSSGTQLENKTRI